MLGTSTVIALTEACSQVHLSDPFAVSVLCALLFYDDGCYRSAPLTIVESKNPACRSLNLKHVHTNSPAWPSNQAQPPRLILRLESDDPTLDHLLVLLDIQLPQLPRTHIEDQPVDLQAPLVHGVDDNGIGQQDFHSTPHVQLDQLETALRLGQGVQEGQVLLAQGAQRHQPGVDQAEFLVAQGRGDAAATGVAADDDVLDPQILHGVLDHAQRVEVRVHQDVGDVAVAEDLARAETQDRGLGTAAVGAAYPQDLRRLALRHGGEDLRVGFGQGAAPDAVVVEGFCVGVIGRGCFGWGTGLVSYGGWVEQLSWRLEVRVLIRAGERGRHATWFGWGSVEV